jgi:ectoine hydroxylase-related dioxygenase (phytanoyl-CoA dioxygenase family)
VSLASLPAVVRPEDCARWLAAIERHVHELSEYASSIRLKSIPGILAEDFWAQGTPVVNYCESALGGTIACDLDECWVRRQYAPRNYPARHTPHSWHQDGALRFDFSGRLKEDQQNGVLEMVTCWIALTPCGVDAPGLELIAKDPGVLIAPANLTAERVCQRFASEEFIRPQMQPGDALLFSGDVLHRTHVSASMSKDRTSLEFRFFPASRIPDRLKSDHFMPPYSSARS